VKGINSKLYRSLRERIRLIDGTPKRNRDVFFATEKFHAVVPARGTDRGGLPWCDNTRYYYPVFTKILVGVALNKAFSSQVWARGDLFLRGFPVLSIWIGAPWMGARLDHR